MYEDRPTALDWIRIAIGLIARGVMWACIIFIVGNAAAQAWSDDAIGSAIFEVLLFPLTFFIYPFAAKAGAQAWPLEDGTSFIPFLIAAVLAYPISTLIGGLRTV